ncbi:MAG: type II 3-dehydroquinate dehydratase [Nitrospinota bacterium]
MKDILFVNGPNINMLGKREPGIYGSSTLSSINKSLRDSAKKEGVKVDFFQSNHEGDIIERIQKTNESNTGVVLINPGAFTHTSIAIRDALLAVGRPVIEIHLSNIFKREPFRRTSFISDIAIGVITGFGPESYFLGLQAAISFLRNQETK